MYIIVSYGTKISEIAHNVQSKVKYTLDQTVGLAVDSVNIFVQGVRVDEPVDGGGIFVSITMLDGKRFAEMVIQGANHLSCECKNG